jgi:hypothetical protein
VLGVALGRSWLNVAPVYAVHIADCATSVPDWAVSRGQQRTTTVIDKPVLSWGVAIDLGV